MPSTAAQKEALMRNNMNIDVFQVIPIDTADYVFVGTSITDGFPVTEMFGPHFKNRGIGNNQLDHILSRIQLVAESRPKTIFLEGGINDVRKGVGAQDAFKKYVAVIDKIKAISPATEVICHTITPVKAGDPVMDLIREFNNRLIEYCIKKELRLIDLYTVMGGDAGIQYSMDNLHPNGEGYKRWKQEVKKLLNH